MTLRYIHKLSKTSLFLNQNKIQNIAIRNSVTNPTDTKPFNDNGVFIQVAGEKDCVGPPDPISNMRPILFHIPANESSIEKQYRLKCQEVQIWNQKFWENHNKNFFKLKEEFAKEIKKKKNLKSNEAVSADEMSEFYKKFLDDNWLTHVKYNRDWYIKNVTIMFLSFRVKLYRLFKKQTAIAK